MKTQLISKLTLTLSLIFIGIFAAQAQLKVVNKNTTLNIKNGLKVTVPARWKYEWDAGDLVIVAPAERADLTFTYMPNKNLDGVINQYESLIANSVKNYKSVNDGTSEKVNGLDTFWVEGEGIIDGVGVNVITQLVRHGSNVLLVFVVLDKDAGAKATNGILDSIGK